MGCSDEFGSDREEPTIRLCQSCGFRLPYTAAPDDTLCVECEESAADDAMRDEVMRDEENRRLSVLADLERRAEDE